MINRKFSVTSSFKRDLKKHYLSLVSAEWAVVSDCLLKGYEIPEKFKDHALTGNYTGYRDCHIKPDLVLIYRVVANTVELHRLNSHSELFG